MIKLFGWETRVNEDLAEKRAAELAMIWKRKVLEAFNGVLNHFIPLVHMIVTYGVFTIVQKKELNASIVFSSLSGFNILRQQMFVSTSSIQFAGDLMLISVPFSDGHPLHPRSHPGESFARSSCRLPPQHGTP
jgi:hypothetical protein